MSVGCGGGWVILPPPPAPPPPPPPFPPPLPLEALPPPHAVQSRTTTIVSMQETNLLEIENAVGTSAEDGIRNRKLLGPEFDEVGPSFLLGKTSNLKPKVRPQFDDAG